MLSIPFHKNLQYKNKTTKWSGYDQGNTLEKHLLDTTSRHILESQGWLHPNSIFYSFNSHGFRDDEFDDSDCSIAMGCSFTQGVGVNVSDSWPKKLSHLLGYRVWNLGIGGCALDTIARIVPYYLDLLNPRSVFLLMPPPWRLEYAVSEQEFEVLLPNTLQSEESGLFIKNWFAHETNSWTNRERNLSAIRYHCMIKNMPLYVFDVLKNGNDRLGRDLMHPGKEWHTDMAKKFFDITVNK